MSVRRLQQQSVQSLKSVETRGGLGIAGKDDIITQFSMKKISEIEKTNMEKNEMLLSLLSQLDIITQSSIQKNSEKQEDRINTLEAHVKELQAEVKFLKTLPSGLMETLGYKKMWPAYNCQKIEPFFARYKRYQAVRNVPALCEDWK